MGDGPLGEISGMTWCGESNRYYAKQLEFRNHFQSDILNDECSNAQLNLENVRLAPVHTNITRSLPVMRSKRSRADSVDCAICLRSGADHKLDPRCRFVQLPCRHSFHLYCVEQWLSRRSGSCPTCRTPVDSSLATAAKCSSSFSHIS